MDRSTEPPRDTEGKLGFGLRGKGCTGFRVQAQRDANSAEALGPVLGFKRACRLHFVLGFGLLGAG